MAAASSFDPLLDRVYEVLVDGAGSSRTIASAHRFRTGSYPDQEDAEASLAAAQGKQVWASVTNIAPTEHNVSGSYGLYEITVRVDLVYPVGDPGVHSAYRDNVGEAAMDAHRVRGALTWPGNLSQTSGGTDTGLASGMLAMAGEWAMEDPDPVARILRATATFTGTIQLSWP